MHVWVFKFLKTDSSVTYRAIKNLMGYRPYVDTQRMNRPVALWSPVSQHKRNFNAKGWLKTTSKMNLQPWASKRSILQELIQPGKYMNTFSFIRWPRSRLHGHFYSAPTLKFTDASEPPTGKQRLQWQSLSVGRLCLSFQRDNPLHPTNSIPMDRLHSQNKKSPVETLVLQSKTWPIRHQ